MRDYEHRTGDELVRPAKRLADGASDLTGFDVRLRRTGPNGEADYTDERYWGERVSFALSAGRVTVASEAESSSGSASSSSGDVLTLTNTRELYLPAAYRHGIFRFPEEADRGASASASSAGAVEANLIVRAWSARIDGQTVYLFNAHPLPLLTGKFYFDTTCLDNTCPDGEWWQGLLSIAVVKAGDAAEDEIPDCEEEPA